MSVCTEGFAYLLCWTRGRGVGLACTRRFSFHEFYNFLPFDFLILIFFWKRFFLPTTFTHTHTHDPRPLPTTHDPRHLATLTQSLGIRWFRNLRWHTHDTSANQTLLFSRSVRISPRAFLWQRSFILHNILSYSNLWPGTRFSLRASHSFCFKMF